jgi:hypothetical protein
MVTICYKAGKLRNGAQRGHGTVFHVVQHMGGWPYNEKALCGAEPALQWSKAWKEGQRPTCPKCLKIEAILEEQQHS